MILGWVRRQLVLSGNGPIITTSALGFGVYVCAAIPTGFVRIGGRMVSAAVAVVPTIVFIQYALKLPVWVHVFRRCRLIHIWPECSTLHMISGQSVLSCVDFVRHMTGLRHVSWFFLKPS